MAAPTAMIETAPLSLREFAFEHFEAFFQSVAEQAQLTTEQQLSLGEQLKESVEKRDKLGNCLDWIRGQAQILREKEKSLAERRRSLEKFEGAIVSSLHQQMLDWGVKKVEGNEYSFTIKKNPAKVVIFDEAAVPGEFIKYEPSIDQQAVKDALDDGKEVPGAKLEQATRLEVK